MMLGRRKLARHRRRRRRHRRRHRDPFAAWRPVALAVHGARPACGRPRRPLPLPPSPAVAQAVAIGLLVALPALGVQPGALWPLWPPAVWRHAPAAHAVPLGVVRPIRAPPPPLRRAPRQADGWPLRAALPPAGPAGHAALPGAGSPQLFRHLHRWVRRRHLRRGRSLRPAPRPAPPRTPYIYIRLARLRAVCDKTVRPSSSFPLSLPRATMTFLLKILHARRPPRCLEKLWHTPTVTGYSRFLDSASFVIRTRANCACVRVVIMSAILLFLITKLCLTSCRRTTADPSSVGALRVVVAAAPVLCLFVRLRA